MIENGCESYACTAQLLLLFRRLRRTDRFFNLSTLAEQKSCQHTAKVDEGKSYINALLHALPENGERAQYEPTTSTNIVIV